MTSTDLFTFRDQPMRTVVLDGEPWFVAADVARILGYRDANALTRRVDDDEKGTQILRTPGGDQAMTVINEPGLYSGVLGSTVPRAREFKRWVTHDVLPQIRRTGRYAGAEQVEYQIPQTYAAALELAFLQAKAMEELEAKAAIDAPKVEAYDALMDADGFYTMDAAAKILGTGRVTLYRRLRGLGIIQPGSTRPYQRHMHHFTLTAGSWSDSQGNIHPTETTRLRPSGLDYIRRRLCAGTEVAS